MHSPIGPPVLPPVSVVSVGSDVSLSESLSESLGSSPLVEGSSPVGSSPVVDAESSPAEDLRHVVSVVFAFGVDAGQLVGAERQSIKSATRSRAGHRHDRQT